MISISDIWNALYDRVVGLIDDMAGGGAYLPLTGGTMTGQIALSGDARVVKKLIFPAVSFFWTLIPTFEVAIAGGGVMIITLPNDWDSSTDMTVKFRWKCGEAYSVNSGEVQFGMNVGAAAIGEVLTPGSPDLTGDINIPATESAIAETSWTIDHTLLADGNSLGIFISRSAIDDGTDPTAAITVMSVDIEYTANALGEAV